MVFYMKDGFIKVAAVSPHIRVADCVFNVASIYESLRALNKQEAKLVVFPELSVTGYTCGDLFLQNTLIKGAEQSVAQLLKETTELDMLFAVGAPVCVNAKLYNCAIVISKGKVVGIVPKTNIPNYAEFYELRHFQPAPKETFFIDYAGQHSIPFGTDILFSCIDSHLKIAVEICEDLWVAQSPSVRHCAAGANVILNLSASDEVIGKSEYRQSLVSAHSAKLMCGYVYADASSDESTTDLVFAGHNLICENGTILAQSQLFDFKATVSELDIERMQSERKKTNTTLAMPEKGYYEAVFALQPCTTTLTRYVSPSPFVPCTQEGRDRRCETVLSLQYMGLVKRIQSTGAKNVVLGISGGLDSSLALLVCVKAFDYLELNREGIVAVTMPCFGTTTRTRGNAEKLCQLLNVTLKTIDITKAVEQHFADIDHDATHTDVVYENSQARERTQVLMDISNQNGGFVVGTGDLSELALGWATYNGDHMSGYAVNASVPKTLVRYIVQYYADACDNPALKAVLNDILATPVSPELLPPKNDEIAQQTEDIVGPYELHDFFIFYFVRLGFSPTKILRLAIYAWRDTYDEETIKKWLRIFIRRFFTQQFKRSCMPDAPKVGTVSLSPRGDWRMPSDAMARMWLDELDSKK